MPGLFFVAEWAIFSFGCVGLNETEPAGWHVFPPKQIDAALELSVLLMNKYRLKDLLGHEDIAPGRKTDPGPAFPMASFRSRVLGRREERAPVFETTTHLNIRSGPGTQYPTVSGGPLNPNTRVEIQEYQGIWRYVDVLETGTDPDIQGWVHGRYLRLIERIEESEPSDGQ